MQDLQIAKDGLYEKGLTLSIVKNTETLFESNSPGISGFLEAIEQLQSKLENASVADRVAGKAIALLCVYARVKAIYAKILSKKGKAVLQRYAVYHEHDSLVEAILDVGRLKSCPFEELAGTISDPYEAYKRLKILQDSLTQPEHKFDAGQV